MKKQKGKTHYDDYLKLGKLLNSQSPYSEREGKACHDEMLFIISHQVYELWFKQILQELHLVVNNFKKNFITEGSLTKIVSALHRVEKIQGLLIDQLDVVETMTPMDFLEFRKLLAPASGFQSSQFREIEILLGLKLSNRKMDESELIIGELKDKDKEKLLKQETEKLLPELVEKWLERLPFTDTEQFVFWKEYKNSVLIMINNEIMEASSNTLLEKETKDRQLKSLLQNREHFEALFDEKLYQKQKDNKLFSLSQKSYLNALFIFLYRSEGVLILPFQLLTSLINIDENFSRWRYRHALMAKRMLGNKMGTGGSSGHKYLKSTVKNNRVFTDLLSLPSYLVPSSQLPKIPELIRKNMNYA